MSIYKCIAVTCLTVVVTACGTTSGGGGDDLSTAAKSLATQTDALKAVAKAESDAKPTVRRDEAIRYWIARGDDKTGSNITSSNPKESFARYACAGTGSLLSVNAATSYMEAYSSAAEASVDPGPDTFSGQFAKFLDQNSAAKTIKLPPADTKATEKFSSCVKSVQQLLDVYDRGSTASDVSDEFVLAALPAAIAAGQSLITSLETVAKDGLKILNAAQQRKHLQDFMSANADSLDKVEKALQSKNELDDAWKRREAFVLGTAYEKFKVILNDKSPAADAGKIRASGLEISSELAAFDAMAAAKVPSEVVKAWVSARGCQEFCV